MRLATSTSKKTNILLWASLAASAAGIIAVASVVAWRQRSLDEAKVATRLRDVQDVLSDCYDKIHEIEAHIPPVLSERPIRSNGSKGSSVPNRNPQGNPT